MYNWLNIWNYSFYTISNIFFSYLDFFYVFKEHDLPKKLSVCFKTYKIKKNQ